MVQEKPLPAGYRIGTKQELCEEFGVAPATLSEALRVLRARGIIDVRPGPGGGTFVAKMGSFGSGDGEFKSPVGVAVDTSRNLFVSDTNNNRVQKFACP